MGKYVTLNELFRSIFKVNDNDAVYKQFNTAVEKRSGPFMDSLKQSSDRATAIISTCLLDNLLESLIRTYFIKDSAVKQIFKNDHILQTYFAKVNIAYFSGLIPKIISHDLKLIGEIRNKFAHETIANLSFNSIAISHRIDKCEIRSKTMDKIRENKIKYVIIVQQLITYLCIFELLLQNSKLPTLVELFKVDDWGIEEGALTLEQCKQILKNE